MYKLRLKNAAQLVCISNNNSLFKVKNDLKNVLIIFYYLAFFNYL